MHSEDSKELSILMMNTVRQCVSELKKMDTSIRERFERMENSISEIFSSQAQKILLDGNRKNGFLHGFFGARISYGPKEFINVIGYFDADQQDVCHTIANITPPDSYFKAEPANSVVSPPGFILYTGTPPACAGQSQWTGTLSWLNGEMEKILWGQKSRHGRSVCGDRTLCLVSDIAFNTGTYEVGLKTPVGWLKPKKFISNAERNSLLDCFMEQEFSRLLYEGFDIRGVQDPVDWTNPVLAKKLLRYVLTVDRSRSQEREG